MEIAMSVGKTISQLAKEYDVSHGTIIKIRKKYRVGPRLKRMPDKPSISGLAKRHGNKINSTRTES